MYVSGTIIHMYTISTLHPKATNEVKWIIFKKIMQVQSETHPLPPTTLYHITYIHIF